MNIDKHIFYLEQLTGKKVILIEEESLDKETFFVPQDLEGRKEKLLQSIYRLLNQEIIEGDLELTDLPIKDLSKVKRVNGNVEIHRCYNLEHLGYLDYVKGSFDCANNRLTTLEGVPKTISNNFSCYNNELTTLEGAFKIVNGDFNCALNNLTTLQGAPKIIKGNFNCKDNKLTTLEGCPKIIEGDFNCSYNKLTTLEGCPKEVSGNFWCWSNIKQFTKKEIKEICNVGGNIYC